jgi:hypothetical protein
MQYEKRSELAAPCISRLVSRYERYHTPKKAWQGISLPESFLGFKGYHDDFHTLFDPFLMPLLTFLILSSAAVLRILSRLIHSSTGVTPSPTS